MNDTKANYVVACPGKVSVAKYIQVISLNTWVVTVCDDLRV